MGFVRTTLTAAERDRCRGIERCRLFRRPVAVDDWLLRLVSGCVLTLWKRPLIYLQHLEHHLLLNCQRLTYVSLAQVSESTTAVSPGIVLNWCSFLAAFLFTICTRHFLVFKLRFLLRPHVTKTVGVSSGVLQDSSKTGQKCPPKANQKYEERRMLMFSALDPASDVRQNPSLCLTISKSCV